MILNIAIMFLVWMAFGLLVVLWVIHEDLKNHGVVTESEQWPSVILLSAVWPLTLALIAAYFTPGPSDLSQKIFGKVEKKETENVD